MERRCDAAAVLLRARESRSSYFWPRRTSEHARRGLDEVRAHAESRASGGGGGGGAAEAVRDVESAAVRPEQQRQMC